MFNRPPQSGIACRSFTFHQSIALPHCGKPAPKQLCPPHLVFWWHVQKQQVRFCHSFTHNFFFFFCQTQSVGNRGIYGSSWVPQKKCCRDDNVRQRTYILTRTGFYSPYRRQSRDYTIYMFYWPQWGRPIFSSWHFFGSFPSPPPPRLPTEKRLWFCREWLNCAANLSVT